MSGVSGSRTTPTIHAGSGGKAKGYLPLSSEGGGHRPDAEDVEASFFCRRPLPLPKSGKTILVWKPVELAYVS